VNVKRFHFGNLLAGCLLLASGTAGALQTLAEIPLDQCTPEMAIASASADASHRAAELNPRALAIHQEVHQILEKYPGHDEGHALNFLAADDRARMTGFLASRTQLDLSVLAEKRLARDMDVVYAMLQLARDAREDKADPTRKALETLHAEEGPKARTTTITERATVYVTLLRRMLRDADDPPHPTDTSQCNVDLALDLEDERLLSELKIATQSAPDFVELARLRQKYGVAADESLNPSAMSADEATRAAVLEPVVQGKTRRAVVFHEDLQNLRRLLGISQLRYDGLREDLVRTRGAMDKKALDAMDKARYNAASPDMQKVWSLWDWIDSENPATSVPPLQK
jgi:hypothetical protein